MKIVGDLRRNDCTTLVRDFTQAHSDVYFFRLDCTETLKYSFTKGGVNITVQPGMTR